MNNLIEAFAKEQLKNELPKFNIGDTVRVHNRIKEGSRERDRCLKERLSQRETAESARPSR